MFWSARREKRKQRNARILNLEKVIANVWASDLETDDNLTFQIGDAQKGYEQNELDHLNQIDLHESAQRWGIDIPPDFYEDEWPLKPTLSEAGVRWVTRETSKQENSGLKTGSQSSCRLCLD